MNQFAPKEIEDRINSITADQARDIEGFAYNLALHCNRRTYAWNKNLNKIVSTVFGLQDRQPRPTIVCLCGSTRFYEMFQKANYEETMAGRIVLSVGFYPHSVEQAHHESVGCTSDQKIALDELHKRKIDLCDEVLVLNVGGYIGDSTRSEIAYAESLGKPIRWLEPRKDATP